MQILPLWEMLLNNILDYVRILVIDFLTEIEHVTKTNTTIKTMLKY
jgi:hypothetical protein